MKQKGFILFDFIVGLAGVGAICFIVSLLGALVYLAIQHSR